MVRIKLERNDPHEEPESQGSLPKREEGLRKLPVDRDRKEHFLRECLDCLHDISEHKVNHTLGAISLHDIFCLFKVHKQLYSFHCSLNEDEGSSSISISFESKNSAPTAFGWRRSRTAKLPEAVFFERQVGKLMIQFDHPLADPLAREIHSKLDDLLSYVAAESGTVLWGQGQRH